MIVRQHDSCRHSHRKDENLIHVNDVDDKNNQAGVFCDELKSAALRLQERSAPRLLWRDVRNVGILQNYQSVF